MRSIDEDPDKKKDSNKKSDSKSRLFSDKSLYANVNSKKSKNYMEGDDKVNGPHLDKESKDVDGNTTVNAGVFK
jgi:hypothetical protein